MKQTKDGLTLEAADRFLLGLVHGSLSGLRK